MVRSPSLDELIPASSLIGDAADIAAFNRDTATLLWRSALLKLGSAALAFLCIAQSFRSLTMDMEAGAQVWAFAAFVVMLAARVAWHYHPAMRPAQGNARWQKHQYLLETGQLSAWIAGKGEWKADDLKHSEPSAFGNGPGILRISPDRLRRWFGVWGWDVPTAPSLFVYQRDAYPTDADTAYSDSSILAGRVASTVNREAGEPACEVERTDTALLDFKVMDMPSLAEPYFASAKAPATNLGQRTLRELHQIGQLNERLLFNETSSIALANEAWGANPVRRDEFLQRTAFLIATEFIAERGLDVQIRQVTGEIRDRLHKLGYRELGLNGGSKGNWISEMIRGVYASINDRLDQAQHSLTIKGTYLSQ